MVRIILHIVNTQIDTNLWSTVLVTVHFYWAVLLFIEEIDKRSPDPPVRHMISKSEASRSIVNTLSQAQLVYETSAYQPSVLLIDPMPETMVSCIASAASALLELFGNGTFSLGACRTMLSVLVAGLKVLCQISPNAKYALEKLNVETMQKSIFKSELASSSDMCRTGTQKLISWVSQLKYVKGSSLAQSEITDNKCSLALSEAITGSDNYTPPNFSLKSAKLRSMIRT